MLYWKCPSLKCPAKRTAFLLPRNLLMRLNTHQHKTHTWRTDTFTEAWTTKRTRQPKWREQFQSKLDGNDWTLDNKARQAIEELLADFHNIFARHRFDIGIDNDFKVKLIPINQRPTYSRNLSISISLKEDFTVELVLIEKSSIITILLTSKYKSPISGQKNQIVNCVFLCICEKITSCCRKTTKATTIPLAHRPTLHNTWQGKIYFVNFLVSKLIIGCIWQTNGLYKCSHWNLTAELPIIEN